MASPSDPSQLHAIIIPLMSQSHLIPMIQLSEVLAYRGVVVTVIMTPVNATRYKPIIDHQALDIRVVALPFPSKEAGLPEGVESLDALPSPRLLKRFLESTVLLRGPLEAHMAQMDPSPSCIVSSLPWTSDVAERFSVPRFAFQGVSCFTLVCAHNMDLHDVYRRVKSGSERFRVPDVPDVVEFTLAQIPKVSREGPDSQGLKEIQEKLKQAGASAEVLLVNTFEELEPEYVKSYQKIVKRVLCVGPLSLWDSFLREKININRGKKGDEHYCMEWLDSMKPRSVIYACFGSLCRLSAKQLIELGVGLDSSKRPFIWIIRDADYVPEIESWFIEADFEERVRSRGLVIRGWAPQVEILSHRAVGGFLTHCGWNSTMEGVCAGVPMITWPMFAEQFYNEKFIVQVLEVGVRIGVEVSMDWCHGKKGDDDGVYVTREDVEKAIEKLMDEGGGGNERRRRARELRESARKAVEGGGSSSCNITLLIQEMMERSPHNKQDFTLPSQDS